MINNHKNILIFMFSMLLGLLLKSQVLAAFVVNNLATISLVKGSVNSGIWSEKIDNFIGQRTRGLMFFASEDYLPAAAILRDFMQTHPEDETIPLFLGDIAYALNQYDQASNYWDQIPTGLIFAHRASLYVRAKDWERARESLQIAELDSFSSFYLEKQKAELYAAFRDFYDSESDNSGQQWACAMAAKAYESAINHQPFNGGVQIPYATLLYECGYKDKSISQLQNIDQSGFSNEARAWANQVLANIYDQESEEAAALSHMQRAIVLDSDNAVYYILLGALYRRVGDEQKSIDALMIALSLSHDTLRQGWAYAELGSVYAQQKNWEASRRAFETALDLDGSRDDYRILLADMLIRAGFINDAREMLLIAKQSPNPEFRSWAEQVLQSIN